MFMSLFVFPWLDICVLLRHYGSPRSRAVPSGLAEGSVFTRLGGGVACGDVVSWLSTVSV
jgi:hypothetical protein